MCKVMGMQASQLFESSDLVNGKFITSILINLKTLQGISDRSEKNASKGATTSDSTASLSRTYSTTGPTTSTSAQPSLTSQKSVSSATSSSNMSRDSSSTSLASLTTPATTSNAGNASTSEPEVFRNDVHFKPEDRKVALVQRWIEVLLTLRCPAGKTLFDWLKSGVILLRLLNAIKPALVKQIYEGTVGYKQIENVQRYLKLAPIASSTAVPLFAVADLTDENNLSAVISHLHAMISIIQRDSKWTGPTLESVSHSANSDSAPISPRDEAPLADAVPNLPSNTISESSSTESISKNPTDSSQAQQEALERAKHLQQEKDTKEAEERARHLQLAQEEATKAAQAAHALKAAAEESARAAKAREEVQRQQDAILADQEKASRIAEKEAQIQLKQQEERDEAQRVKAAAEKEQEQKARLSESEELDRARKQLNAERQAMAEERRVFAERMQEETERRLKEMALKLEQETAAVISRERSKSQAISDKLDEERREREMVARQLEKERRERLILLEESERQKVDLAITAQKQMQAVADRLQEETSKRLEAMASKITSEAMQKAEQELRRKDEHLMKQLERERKLRSRLDALEEEKKSLSKTFEKKFSTLESELKAVKNRSNSNSITNPTTPVSGPQNGSSSQSHVDSDTLEEFRAWNNRWRVNRKLTKQLTRTLTEIESSIGTGSINLHLSTDFDEDKPLNLITPRSELSEDLSARDSTYHSDADETPSSPIPSRLGTSDSIQLESPGKSDLGGDQDDDESLNLEDKGWLDDDWSEEEDWESERSDFDDNDDEDEEEGHAGEAANSEAEESPRRPVSKLKSSSPAKDDWSEFSSVKLPRFS